MLDPFCIGTISIKLHLNLLAQLITQFELQSRLRSRVQNVLLLHGACTHHHTAFHLSKVHSGMRCLPVGFSKILFYCQPWINSLRFRFCRSWQIEDDLRQRDVSICVHEGGIIGPRFPSELTREEEGSSLISCLLPNWALSKADIWPTQPNSIRLRARLPSLLSSCRQLTGKEVMK